MALALIVLIVHDLFGNVSLYDLDISLTLAMPICLTSRILSDEIIMRVSVIAVLYFYHLVDQVVK